MHDKQVATQFAQHAANKGFTVYLAKSETYGFLTDNRETRALSFGVDFGAIKFSGNYKRPSQSRGTGWRMERTASPEQLSASEIAFLLHANAPQWALRGTTGPVEYATAKDMLEQWGPSSKYEKLDVVKI